MKQIGNDGDQLISGLDIAPLKDVLVLSLVHHRDCTVNILPGHLSVESKVRPARDDGNRPLSVL
ncbi:uncharacterized protein EI90DRAFT_3090518, partial [Cantharellus anzutake]|uniref:uncharacterized protein n=1 Tax=Cantharellus anzutake TaxID=1750568 RepID=UPI001904EEE6